jgi:geranylgeranyl diphosphate synthase type I
VSAIGSRMLDEVVAQAANGSQPAADLGGERWRGALRRAVRGIVAEFVDTRCAPEL